MSKYTFTCEHWDGSKVTFEKDADALSDVLESFEFFLKGAGFYLDGQVDIVPEETTTVFDDDDEEESLSFIYGGANMSDDIQLDLSTNAALHPDFSSTNDTVIIK